MTKSRVRRLVYYVVYGIAQTGDERPGRCSVRHPQISLKAWHAQNPSRPTLLHHAHGPTRQAHEITDIQGNFFLKPIYGDLFEAPQ